jgi:TrmH family RNA methyltransferase
LLAVVIQKRQFIEDLPAGGIHLAAALVSPQDPGNVGTILRTLDACGAGPLFLLDGGVELFHPSCVRASMGSIFWIPVVETTFGEFNSWRQERRVLMVGTSAHARMDYEDFDSQGKPVILLLGSEQKGLTETHTAGCDILLSIPMKGHSSSLNLAVAAGILLYQIGGKK